MNRISEELDKVQAEDQNLHFRDVASNVYMDISMEGTEQPLEITIIDLEEEYTLTYSMNENELFALFNLLYKILKRNYTEKLEELGSILALDRSTARDKAREIEERQLEEGDLT